LIEEILKKAIGLNAESISKKKVDADVSLRMRECGIKDLADYIALVERSPEELKRLIDTVTVPETWFFRLPGAFECLEKRLRNTIDSDAPQLPFRVLCMPCSTGEEPYSVAMLMYECGLKREGFVIDAIDVNTVSLNKARQGVYTLNSFRGVKQRIIDSYFKQSDRIFELEERIRKSVNFSRVNVLEMEPPSRDMRYDVIFCRNMLIYFDRESQLKVIDLIERSLKDDGILFSGHSEAGIFFDSSFVPLKVDAGFAFIKKSQVKHEPRQPRISTDNLDLFIPPVICKKTESPKDSAMRRERRKRAESTVIKVSDELSPQVQPEEPQKFENPLRRAEELANSGQLAEAVTLCADCIAHDKLNPKAYCLMGMIQLSSRKYSDAEKFFNKALYLHPDYYEALLGVALTHEHTGNVDAARAFRNRAGNINQT
jgi:chemotaxis protein methyltransferase WspC